MALLKEITQEQMELIDAETGGETVSRKRYQEISTAMSLDMSGACLRGKHIAWRKAGKIFTRHERDMGFTLGSGNKRERYYHAGGIPVNYAQE